MLALVLVLEIDPSTHRDFEHSDYDHEHERRFAEHARPLAAKPSLAKRGAGETEMRSHLSCSQARTLRTRLLTSTSTTMQAMIAALRR